MFMLVDYRSCKRFFKTFLQLLFYACINNNARGSALFYANAYKTKMFQNPFDGKGTLFE